MRNNDLLTPEEHAFDDLMIPAVRRARWARDHIVNFQNGFWKNPDRHVTVPAELRNELGDNIYPILIDRLLYTASRTTYAAIALLKHPLGSSPIELLLRASILSSTKVIYLLAPDDSHKRENRAKQIYDGDRYQYEMAIWSQEVIDDPDLLRPKGKLHSETRIIRSALDYLVLTGNARHNQLNVVESDLLAFRTRIVNWWSLYSAVSHANIWQIESSATPAPTGLTHTTGDLSQAFFDIGWLTVEATALCLNRFGLAELIEPLES